MELAVLTHKYSADSAIFRFDDPAFLDASLLRKPKFHKRVHTLRGTPSYSNRRTATGMK